MASLSGRARRNEVAIDIDPATANSDKPMGWDSLTREFRRFRKSFVATYNWMHPRRDSRKPKDTRNVTTALLAPIVAMRETETTAATSITLFSHS